MIARVLIGLVRVYQWLIPPLFGLLFGRLCRFEPSCSRYAVLCLQMHGAGRGSLLSLVRLCKCHPFHPGGYDPPPLPLPRKADAAAKSNGEHDASAARAQSERLT